MDAGSPVIDDTLLARGRSLLDAATRESLAWRLGVHPALLAMSVAGVTTQLVASAYRAALDRVTREHGVEAIDLSPPHLVREGDHVRLVDAALDLRPMIHGLQLASAPVTHDSATARELAAAALDDALHCLLGELVAERGAPALAALADDAFAALLAERAGTSARCLGTISPRALAWTSATARQAVERAGIAGWELADLERLLGLRPIAPGDDARLLERGGARPRRLPRPLPVAAAFPDDHARVPVNHASWALQQAIRDAILGGWQADEAALPVHVSTTRDGRGQLRVSLRPDDAPAEASELWRRVRALDDLTADALLVCLAHWTAATPPGGEPAPVWITVDAILDARGVRRIRRRGEPAGWQHGHRREDRLAAGRALARLEGLWLDVLDVEVAPPRGDAPARRVRAESRALAVLDRITERDDTGELVLLAARVVPGGWLRAWQEAGIQGVGLLARQTLAYDPWRERPERWLARWLAFAFRWNARRRAPALRLRVATLLEHATLVADPARPQRTRDRLEQALARLAADGVIAGWRYEGDPGLLPARRWLADWLAMLVAIEPPPLVRAGNRRPRLPLDG